MGGAPIRNAAPPVMRQPVPALSTSRTFRMMQVCCCATLATTPCQIPAMSATPTTGSPPVAWTVQASLFSIALVSRRTGGVLSSSLQRGLIRRIPSSASSRLRPARSQAVTVVRMEIRDRYLPARSAMVIRTQPTSMILAACVQLATLAT